MLLRFLKPFESSVVLDGTKTKAKAELDDARFESSVVLDGTKTAAAFNVLGAMFESSVVLDGTKTFLFRTLRI